MNKEQEYIRVAQENEELREQIRVMKQENRELEELYWGAVDGGWRQILEQSHQRERVQNKVVKTIKVSCSYGGRLPVGKER